MKNLIKIMPLAFVIAIAAFSCELDRFPYDSIEQSQAFQTGKDATTLENGLYSDLRGRVYGIYTYSTDVQADQLNATLDYGNRNGFPHKWSSFLADDYTIRDTWRGYYGALVNVNNVINNIDRIPLATATDSASIPKIKGEAYLLRAYYYHQLIQRWAKDYEPSSASADPGVPLVLTFDVTLLPARATVAQVYSQILADIATAKTLLANVTGVAGSTRLNIDCVLALEAQVNLCMHNWTAAVVASNTLITSGIYPLVTNTAALTTMWINDGSAETIFNLFFSQPSELGNANSIYLGFVAASNKYTPDFVPEQWIIDLYQASDIRKAVYFAQKPLFIQGTNYPNIYCINKFAGNPTLFTAATTNYMQKPKIFRIAEMYLISAEAAAQTPATEANGLATLNQLRLARGLTALTGLTGAALMDAIKAERTRELLCEGKRLDDLKRWKMGFTRSAAQNVNLINVGADFDTKTVAAGDDKFVWGIPTNDLTTNPKIVQNPGW